jgi:hypothetical protein
MPIFIYLSIYLSKYTWQVIMEVSRMHPLGTRRVWPTGRRWKRDWGHLLFLDTSLLLEFLKWRFRDDSWKVT